MLRRDHVIAAVLSAAALATDPASAAPALAAPPAKNAAKGAADSVAPAPPPATEVVKFEFHGFAGVSLYGQNASFTALGGGEGAWFVVPPALTDDRFVLGADVRQTRMNFSLTGTPLGLWGFKVMPKAVVELDFFGGTSFGNFGDSSLFPRLRLAYADLVVGNTTLRLGEDHQLVLGILLPSTVGHLAFPLSYQAGTIGWRYPGLTVFENLLISESQVIELAFQVTKAPWVVSQSSVVTNATVTPNTTIAIPGSFGTDNGAASGLPAIEARVKYKSAPLDVFVAGHWSQVDKSGVGTSFPSDDKRTVLALTAGIRLAIAPVTVLGAGYVGRNTAPLLGSLLQFQALDQATGDIKDRGVWGQLGVDLTSELSAWALGGIAKPDQSDVFAARQTRLQNTVGSGMLRYKIEGFALGLEYTHWVTETLIDAATGAASPAGVSTNISGNQLMLSGMYFF